MAVSHLVGFPVQVQLALGLFTAATGAGSAVLNDFDHQHSTASTAFGPLSTLIHKSVIELHYTVCAINNPHDRTPPGAHRGITHWWPFPIVVGGVVAWGCWVSWWFMYAMITMLFTLAIRGLTVPEYRERKNATHLNRMAMKMSYWLLNLVPPLRALKKGRKFVTRKERIGGRWTGFDIELGKMGTVAGAAALTWMILTPDIAAHGVWLGVVMAGGMNLHNLGDAPTESGLPGVYLEGTWRLPKWLAFKAGGWFEVVAVWIPLSILGLYLIPGVRPHAEVIAVLTWIGIGLGTIIVTAAVIETFTNVRQHTRR